MTWVSVLNSIFYYVLLPVVAFFRSLLVVLAPLLHLGNHLLSGLLLPLRLLAKLETLYIYLGVAAVIGLVTGSILHLTSTVLVELFNLVPTAEDKRRSIASVRDSREQIKLEEVWQNSSLRGIQGGSKAQALPGKDYAEWLDKSSGKRRDNQRLVKQTILEEDDDSEEGF